jgi:cyclohexanecarboxylate-CoA ligase
MTGHASEPETFSELISWRAKTTPDALMLEEPGGQQLSFGEYGAAVRAAAAAVEPDEVVAWQLPTSINAAVTAGALAWRGCLQVPLLTAWGSREVGFALEQLGVNRLVVPDPAGVRQAETVARLAATRPYLLVTGPIVPPRDAPPDRDEESAGAPRGGWVFYTSGTTADPKGARHRDASVISAARGMATVYGLRARDRHAVVFPFTHIGGIIWLAAGLLVGMPQLMVQAFDPPTTIPAMRGFGVTVAGAGTAFHQAYLQAQREAGAEPVLPAVRLFVGGAAPKPPTLHAEVKAAFGIGIASAYGLTECPVVTINPPDGPDDKLAVSEGLPAPGAVVRVVDTAGRWLPDGQEGEVRVGGSQRSEGYADPGLDAEGFDADGLVRTGDLGRLEEGYLVVTGRLKDVIIRKGETISAQQVEDLLHRHPAVAEAAVVGVPDDERGERAVAVIAPRDASAPPSLSALTGFLVEEGLMKQKAPEQLEIVTALPRNTAGKVQKIELRRRLSTTE